MTELPINQIICGDCLEVMRQWPDGCADAIVTDPPYAIPTVVAQGRSITRNVGDLTIVEQGLSLYVGEMRRILSSSGRIFIFCDQTSYPVLFRCLYSRFNLALLVWDKGRIGMGREFRKSYELIVHGWFPETPVFSDGIGRPDVLRCPPLGSERKHPAQKPIQLVEQLLRACGDIVVDPFCGSGTTCHAAQQLSRSFVGIDISEEYCQIARERLRAAETGVPVEDARNGQGALW